MNEMEEIKKNEEDFAVADNELAKEMAETAANIPDPPAGDLGTIAPPAGYGKAYTPGLVKQGLMEKPVAPDPVTEAEVAAIEDPTGLFANSRRASKWRTNK
jgi:hypothetical protein